MEVPMSQLMTLNPSGSNNGVQQVEANRSRGERPPSRDDLPRSSAAGAGAVPTPTRAAFTG